MRLCIVSTQNSAPWGGSEVLWAKVASLAIDRGHAVTLVLGAWPEQPKPVQALVARGARLVEPRERYHRRIRRFAYRVRDPLAFLEKDAPDVVLIGQAGPYDLVYEGIRNELLARTLVARAIPFAVVVQQVRDGWALDDAQRVAGAATYGAAKALFYVSHHNKRLSERTLAARFDRAEVVDNPADVPEPSKVPWPAPGPARLACVARLDASKGQEVMLEALASPEHRARDWRLRLYGRGPDEAHLKRLAARFGLADRVDFAGHVDDVRSIWADNEIFALASFAEGTPLALLEAMVCARPAITTDVGGCIEVIDRGKSGFVADAPSARSFGAALSEAFARRGEWRAMGEAARALSEARIDRHAEVKILDRLEAIVRG